MNLDQKFKFRLDGKIKIIFFRIGLIFFSLFISNIIFFKILGILYVNGDSFFLLFHKKMSRAYFYLRCFLDQIRDKIIIFCQYYKKKLSVLDLISCCHCKNKINREIETNRFIIFQRIMIMFMLGDPKKFCKYANWPIFLINSPKWNFFEFSDFTFSTEKHLGKYKKQKKRTLGRCCLSFYRLFEEKKNFFDLTRICFQIPFKKRKNHEVNKTYKILQLKKLLNRNKRYPKESFSLMFLSIHFQCRNKKKYVFPMPQVKLYTKKKYSQKCRRIHVLTCLWFFHNFTLLTKSCSFFLKNSFKIQCLLNFYLNFKNKPIEKYLKSQIMVLVQFKKFWIKNQRMIEKFFSLILNISLKV